MPAPIWAPGPDRVARANVTRFMAAAAGMGAPVSDWESLYQWSITRPVEFWPLVWEFCGVVAEERRPRAPWDEVVRGIDRMAPPDPELGPRWFPGARLNFAENLLRFDDDLEAIVSWDEEGRRESLTFAALGRRARAFAKALSAAGVEPGDRVAGFLPNIPEAVIAMLGTALIGAVWSSCSPDFGVGGVLDRFGQIHPKVLVAADGYRYAGKRIDCLTRVGEVAAQIGSIQRVVVVPYLGATSSLSGIRDSAWWDDFVSASAAGPE